MGPAHAGRPARCAPGRVPSGGRWLSAPLPCLDPGLPDELERLGGDGRSDRSPPGCEESASMDEADLVVINTCAIREGAEQKVIGRQGHLARLKAARPGLRVVLTGCSVREPDRAGLRRRYPAVDVLPAPGRRAGTRRPVGAGVGAGRHRPGQSSLAGVGADDDRRARCGGGRRPPARPRVRGPSGRGPSLGRLADQRLAADHLRLRQDVHLLHRAVQPGVRSGAGPSTTSWPRRERWPPPATVR